jgi:hypothetical protein
LSSYQNKFLALVLSPWHISQAQNIGGKRFEKIIKIFFFSSY